MITDPLYYMAAIPAVIFLGLAKGGFSGIGVLAMPILALVISPIQGAAIILPILIVQDALGVWIYRRHWDRRNLAILLPGAAFGIVLATLFAARVSASDIALVVGLISVGFAGRRLFLEWRRVAIPPASAGLIPGLFWGMVSGFTSMIANAGAPPYQVYVMPQRLPRDQFVGTTILFFAAINWIKLPAFILLDQFNHDSLINSLVMMPLAVLSTWAGVILVRRVSPDGFYRYIYLLLLLVGVKLVWDGVSGMI